MGKTRRDEEFGGFCPSSICVFLESLGAHHQEQLQRGCSILQSHGGECQRFLPRGPEARGQLGKLFDMGQRRGRAGSYHFFWLNKSEENFLH